jgi:hypothetical protein
MKKLLVPVVAVVISVLGLLVYFGTSSDQGQAASHPQVVSALGVAQVQGRDVFVDVTVLVPLGSDAAAATAAAEAALRAQGARPVESAGLESEAYTVTGLFWDSLPVVQYYNESGEPNGIDGQGALEGTHAMWDGVAASSFDIDFGGLTNRCPSLVAECPGSQQFDGFNDVTFISLQGPCNSRFGCTIGVTWFSTTIDEADIGLNTKVAWSNSCVNVSGSIDVQTVLGHENGHVVGLGHSLDRNALMYASYQGARCGLGADDEAGVAALYPAGTPQPTSTPVDTPVPTNTPAVEPTATPTPDEGGPASCPPGRQRRGLC